MATYDLIGPEPPELPAFVISVATPAGTNLTSVELALDGVTTLTLRGANISVSGGKMTGGIITHAEIRRGSDLIDVISGGGAPIANAATLQSFYNAPVTRFDILATLLTGGPDRIQSALGGTLIGTLGADHYIGGPQAIDMVSYRTTATSSSAGVTANLDIGVGVGGDAQGDAYTGIEHLVGSPFNDVLVGKAGVANRLNGGAGDDWLVGEGIDMVQGGADADVFFGGQGGAINNVQFHLTNIETVWGSVAGDVIEAPGATANLVMIGQGGADRLIAGGGNDFIYFDRLDADVFNTTGVSNLDAGSGFDWGVASLSPAGVDVGILQTGFEVLWGSPFADRLRGGLDANNNPVVIVGDAGDDVIEGGRQADFLYGFADDDRIQGGYGNDTIVPGGGADTVFYDEPFSGTAYADTIWFFDDGVDRIRFGAASGVAGMADIEIRFPTGAPDRPVVVTKFGDQIWLLDVDNLTAANFIFG